MSEDIKRIAVDTMEDLNKLENIAPGALVYVKDKEDTYMYIPDDDWRPLELKNYPDAEREMILFLSKDTYHLWTKLLSEQGIIQLELESTKNRINPMLITMAKTIDKAILACVGEAIVHPNPDTGSVIMYWDHTFFDSSFKVDVIVDYISTFIKTFNMREYRYLEIITDPTKGDIVIDMGSYSDNWSIGVSKSISINL